MHLSKISISGVAVMVVIAWQADEFITICSIGAYHH